MDIANFQGLRSLLMEESGGDAAGGGGGSVATVDTSSAVDIGGTGDGGGGNPTTDLATTDADSSLANTGGFRAYEGGKLTKPAAEGLAAIRTTHPKVAKAASTAFAVANKLYSLGLGAQPFKTIQGLMNFAKQVGGPQGLEAYRAQAADIDEQDALYAAGDPKLLQRMTHTQKADGSFAPNPPAIAAFAKLIPHAFDMLEKFSPKLYLRQISRRVVSHMDTLTFTPDPKKPDEKQPLELPYRIMRLEEALASIQVADGNATIPASKLNAIQSDVAALTGTLNYLRGTLTNLEPEDLTPKVDPAEERIELDRQRRELTEKAFLVERTEAQNKLYRTEWKKLNIDKRATAQQAQEIESGFFANIDVVRRSIPDYRQKTNAFVESRDQSGYMRWITSEFLNKKIPELLGKQVRKVLSTKPADTSASAAATTTTNTATATQQTQPAAQSTTWKKVDSRPETNDLKMGPRYTTAETYKNRRGFAAPGNHWKLPPGTPVTW